MNLQNVPLAFFPFLKEVQLFFKRKRQKEIKQHVTYIKGPEGGRLASDSLHTFRNLMLFIKRTKLFTEWAGSWCNKKMKCWTGEKGGSSS
jgi:hypothetical protein